MIEKRLMEVEHDQNCVSIDQTYKLCHLIYNKYILYQIKPPLTPGPVLSTNGVFFVVFVVGK